MALVLTKQLALVEDIEFGMGVTAQARGGNMFNAAYLPYSTTQSVTNALDDRYLKTESDALFALMDGNSSQRFNVANGHVGTEAVNFSQLDLRETKVVVATKS